MAVEGEGANGSGVRGVMRVLASMRGGRQVSDREFSGSACAFAAVAVGLHLLGDGSGIYQLERGCPRTKQ